MKLRKVSVVAALAVIAGLLAPSSGSAATAAVAPLKAATPIDTTYVEGNDPQAPLFNPLVVNRIDLTLDQNGINALTANSYADYQPGTIKWTLTDGTVIGPLDVGIHLKGMWGSHRELSQKAAFKVKINYGANTNQRIMGLRKLTLNNMVQDPSMLHEATAYRLFRAVGVPAPRVGYDEVYLNGTDYGLHANIETYDKSSLKRWYGSTQHLFEGGYGQELNLGAYNQLQVDEGDPANISDLQALADANTNLSGAAWYTAMRQLADLKEITTEWAVEHYISHWDGYERGWPNNYYVHSNKHGVFTMLPWGSDQTWNNAPYYSQWNAPFVDNGALMTSKCMAYAPCAQLYNTALARIAAVEPGLQLNKQVDAIWSVIQPWIASDPRKESDLNTAAFFMQVTKDTITTRAPALAQYLSPAKELPNLSITYPDAVYSPNATIRPTVVRRSDGQLKFYVGWGADVCKVNVNTGAVTALAAGSCRVIVDSPADSNYYFDTAQYSVTFVNAAGTASIAPIASIPAGSSVPLSITKNSTSTPVVTTVGKCHATGINITADAGFGYCSVSVTVPADSTVSAATTTARILMVKGTLANYNPITEATWTDGSVIPSGATLRLIKTPSAITGPCAIIPSGVKATATSGTCSVTIPAFADSNYNYATKTFSVGVGPAAQTWPASLAAPGTFLLGAATTKPLSSAATVVTNLGKVATFTVVGSCSVSVISNRVSVTMTQAGVCTVKASAPAAYRTAAISRTWVLRK
jgi:hypothetical protein